MECGVNAIRSVNPNATIVGPSTAVYWDHGSVDLEQFLAYANANNVLPDIISWHSTDHNLNSELSKVKQFAAANDFDASRISINEYSAPQEAYRPGAVPFYLDAIESNGVESSARTCWDTCYDTSLDGLVTSSGEPRSIWWLYQRYGRMSGSTVMTVSGASLDAVASQDVGVAYALIGRSSVMQTPQKCYCKT